MRKLSFLSFIFIFFLNHLYAEDSQFFGIAGYRVGPYAAGGTPFFTGYIDYLKLLNERDGGLNKVKISWEECEFEYNTAKGLECYERLKTKGKTGPTAIHPMSTGVTYGLMDRAPKDEIPLITLGYGRTDATDGRVFPWVFPLVTNYWSQASAIIEFINQKAKDGIQGKKIVLLYHDSAYGKEPQNVIEQEAKKLKFELVKVPVPHPGNEQQSQWLQIRKERPDWVILWGWGVMNATAIKTAQKVGFKRNKIVGNWWAGSEIDTQAAGGKVAKGYYAATLNLSGSDFKVVQDIKKYVYDKGKGGNEKYLGTVLWNRGVVAALVTVEGVKKAQSKYGNKVMTGAQVRWGLENLSLSKDDLKKLGFGDMVPPIKLSCENHEGAGLTRFQQWDGKQWTVASDWIGGDKKLVRDMIEKSAAQYAKEKNITPKCL